MPSWSNEPLMLPTSILNKKTNKPETLVVGHLITPILCFISISNSIPQPLRGSIPKGYEPRAQRWRISLFMYREITFLHTSTEIKESKVGLNYSLSNAFSTENICQNTASNYSEHFRLPLSVASSAP